MSRVKASTRGRWAAILLTGALTQFGGAVAMSAPVLTGDTPNQAAAPGQTVSPRAAVRGLLIQARAHLRQGNFNSAENLAREAAKQNLSYTANEDTPVKVLQEIERGKKDPHLLLTASRSALARKEYLLAEKYARDAEKQSSIFTFPVWGDSPAAALKAVAEAKQKSSAAVASKAVPAKGKETATSKPIAKQPTPKLPTPKPQLADSRPVPAVKNRPSEDVSLPTEEPTPVEQTKVAPPKAPPTKVVQSKLSQPTQPAQPKAAAPAVKTDDEARKLIRQARAALTANKLDEATKLTALARDKKPNLSWWEDNPERLDADIRRLEAKKTVKSPVVQTSLVTAAKDPEKPQDAKADKKPAPVVKPAVAANERPKDKAKSLLAEGRKQLAAGKLDEATQTAQRIKTMNTVSWGLFEDSPDRLNLDINKARVKRDREEADRLMAQGRKLYEKGDYEKAARLAYRAQKLHGEYGIWDLSDRPSRLLADIHTAQAKSRKAALPPPVVARNSKPAGKPEPTSVKPTIIDPASLNTTPKDTAVAAVKTPTATGTKPSPTGLPEGVQVAQATTPPAPKAAETLPAAATPAQPAKAASGTATAVAGLPTMSVDVGSNGGSINSLPQLPGGATNSLPAMPGSETATVKATTPVEATAPAASPATPKAETQPNLEKLKAQQLVAEAQRLHRLGKLEEARDKVVAAQKLGVSFGIDEVGPDSVYQQIAVDIRQRIDLQMRQANEVVLYGKGDLAARYHQAEAKLEDARGMARSFGQDLQPIEMRLSEIRDLRAKAAEAVAKKPTPAVSPETKVVQNGTPPQPAPAVVAPSVAPPSAEQKMLEQARVELMRGEVGSARRLTEQTLMRVQKGPAATREQAVALLRTIDAEEYTQKRMATERAFEAAMAAYRRREYNQASAMIAALDLRMLKAEQQGQLREISMTPEMATGAALARQGSRFTAPVKSAAPDQGSGIVRTAASTPGGPGGGVGISSATDLPGTSPGDHAPAGDADSTQLDNYKARQAILMDKLKRDVIEVQREAADKFRAGQREEALEKLQDFVNHLNEERLPPGQLAALRRPIESRLSSYRLMKAQDELASGRMMARQNGMDKVVASQKAAELKQKNVERLMKEFNGLFKEGKYVEAESIASRVLEIDPDNGVASAAIYMARRQRDVNAAKTIKNNRERLNLASLNASDNPGDNAATAAENDIAFDKKTTAKNSKRTALTPIELGRPSAQEKAIERQLTKPITISFDNVPLDQVLRELRDVHSLNIVTDEPALREAGISMDSPISMKLDKVSLKSTLNLILHQVKLTYMIKDDVLQITTEDHAKGKQKTITYPVADLVIPIDNSTTSPSPLATLANVPQGTAPNGSGAATPYNGPFTLGPGTPASSPGSQMNAPANSASNTANGGTTTTKARTANTQEEQLIQLITRSIEPRTWGDMGGQGTIEYHPLTLSLVVNQTVDIQEQIQDLLQSLRRLQDQEVAVEVRFISVTEDFFERMGVNFNMNILTDKANRRFQPALLNNSFVANSNNQINSFDPGRFLAGLTPAGTLTPNLDIPITNSSFLQAIPNYGGYVSGGGLSLGLAFLSDIQVFLFLEAVQGDTRANVMQAPKLTMFNGQQATLNVSEQQLFLTQISIVNVPGTGQYGFLPLNQPLTTGGVQLTITPIISADRRFVRLNLQPNLINAVPGTLTQVAPVAVPIFTANDTNLGAGQPIIVTQYVQQPAFTTVAVSTTVVVPDGGTVVMGGLKRLAESRNEFGPPILSKIPYINRLFKNVGYGRSTESLLIMVTPRIIIQEEEEFLQTGFRANQFVGQ